MKLPRIALGLVIAALAGWGQPRPAFEAASLKVSKEMSWRDRSDIGLITQRGATLRDLVSLAYGVQEDRVTGGPKWIDSDRFDVDAKSAGPAQLPELSRMLQTLLAERFHLETHKELRQVPGYALVVVRGGIRAKPADSEERPSSNSHNGSLTARAIKMDRFAEWLARRTASPVVDATGLTTPFDFTMEWDATLDRTGLTSSMADAVPTATTPKGQTLFVALQEQLGLRLEPRNVPLELIVVDRAEKPTVN